MVGKARPVRVLGLTFDIAVIGVATMMFSPTSSKSSPNKLLVGDASRNKFSSKDTDLERVRDAGPSDSGLALREVVIGDGRRF